MKKVRLIILSIIITANIFTFYSFAYAPVFDKSDTDTIVFVSDVHNTGENASGNRMNRLFPLVAFGERDFFEHICDLGDIGDHAIYGDDYWLYAGNAMDAIDNCEYLKADKGIHIAGNHEWKNGYFADTQNINASRVEKTVGRVVTGESYEIFCFGSTSQDALYAKNEYKVLDDYLCSVSDDAKRMNKQLFIITHFPLHKSNYSEMHENIDRTVRILNKYGEKLKITFVWGHNHTHDDLDPYYDFMIKPNSIVQGKKFKFSYLSAGVMSDNTDYYNTTPNILAKCIVVSINTENEITFKAYKNDGSSFILEKKTANDTQENGDISSSCGAPDVSNSKNPPKDSSKIILPVISRVEVVKIDKPVKKIRRKKLSKKKINKIAGIRIKYSVKKNLIS